MTDIGLDQFIAREPAAVWRVLTEPEGSQDTTITWRLEPEGTGTRLFLVHAGFVEGSPSFKGMSNGRPSILTRIEPALE